MNDVPEPRYRTILRVLRVGLIGIGGLVFWFGDRFLRELWHLSFSASLMGWVAALGVIIVLAVLLSGLINS